MPKSLIAQLKLAASDADNALDELHYEALRRDALRRGHKVNSGVRGFFSPNYNPLLFKYNIGKRLQQIVERIDGLVLQMNQFRLIKDRPVPVDERMQTHSYVKEKDVIGREGDRQKIVQMLLGAGDEELSIIPIVGLGGLGKTTLAQLIFNDVKVKAHFQKLMWICVSEEFSVPVIVKNIIDSAIGSDCGLKNDNMELLQQRLREEIRRKRCLLVLDDVWNEDAQKWDSLRTLLGSCGTGSAIVVTTRSGKVASVMGILDPFSLKQLNLEDSWALFSRRAFGAGLLESAELSDVGKKIVEKCCGVPLAVKSMGGLMSTKHNIRDWLEILKSNTWDVENHTRSALMLSYKHLPSCMKQCFLFCAVFPKDYEIDKLDLIHLWISNGFIPSKVTSDLEATANGIFLDLVWRSFFQDVKQIWSSTVNSYGYHDVTTCKIHDLMHDLAKEISGDECFSLGKPSEIRKVPKNVRHLALPSSHKYDFVMRHCRNIHSMFSLRKYAINSYKDHNFMKSTLRVIGLQRHGFKKLSFEPAFMKHLRYLDLSDSSIKVIPEATSALYNLQVLMLNNCCYLNQLPEGMKYMISLRHVYLDNCSRLECTPGGLGQLTSLRTLTKYMVGDDPACGIKELKDLNLGGKLQLCDLLKVTSPSNAGEANLEAKQDLEHLMFCFGTPEVNHSQEYPAEEILNALKPHNGLKVLNIDQYLGTKFPNWMTCSMMLHKLLELSLTGCVNCHNIPQVCQLPCLEVLRLENMNNLKYLCSGYSLDEGCDHFTVMFPVLKLLSLKWMELLERWQENDVGNLPPFTFEKLDEMEIIGCPKLTTLPNIPVLKSLCVAGNRVLIDLAADLTTLSSLNLSLSENMQSDDTKEIILADHSSSWGPLTKLRLEGFNGLIPHDKDHRSDQVTQINNLSLIRCDCFILIQSDALQSPLWFWKLFTSLGHLGIHCCDSLTFWPDKEFQSLTSLKSLDIIGCENFTGSSATPLSVNPTEEGLRNLEYLYINSCPNLVVFPTCFISLKYVSIGGNSKLESIPEGLGHQDTLVYFTISRCPSLKYLPASIRCLSNLRDLVLTYCNSLAGLPEGMHNLTALKSLQISNCPGMKALPEGLQQRLNILESLYIEDCPALARRCRRGGDYWNKVKDIPYLE